MILIGASGHAKVIIDILERNGQNIDCLVDANPSIKSLCAYEVEHDATFDFNQKQAIISIGSNSIRKKLAECLPCIFNIGIHPQSILDTTVVVKEGTVIMAGAIINRDTKIGKHVIVNTSASIDHDCILEDFTHVSPNVTLCGAVYVGEGTHIGAGVVAIPNIKIGKWAVIGAGAVIIEDIPDFAVVVGNPGRIIKYTNG